MNMTDFDIKKTYLQFLEDDSEMTMPIAAIESLVTLLKVKQPSTSSELIMILQDAIADLKQSIPNAISLSAGCDLFMRFVLRNTHLYHDYESCKRHLVENGQLFLERSKASRDKIAEIGSKFITDDDIVLVHSFSRAVYTLLSHAADKKIRFRVVVTEARPTFQGQMMAKLLREKNVPVSLIVDSSVGFVIHKVDKVLVGAEGVAESGGIINHVGTYQIGVLAKAANKPLYVVAESHKFVRMFPLAPDDIPTDHDPLHNFSTKDEESVSSPLIDFTPHDFLTALITDLGVLTPSAVSEELIKMWYD
jgi:translation initiation factor eIF-2B subunit alpha